MTRLRLAYITLALLTILLGLSVHLHGSALGTTAQDITGDALYAMMIAWWIGALTPGTRVLTRSAVAFAICAAIEFSQLLHTPFADAMRATRMGHLVFGSGFDPRDLAAYAIGVVVAAVIEHAWIARTKA